MPDTVGQDVARRRRKFGRAFGDGVTKVAVEVLPEVGLRPLAFRDLGEVWAWTQDPEIAGLIGQKFASVGDVLEWWRNFGVANGRLAYAIMVHGQLIGDVVLENISWRSAEAEVRICIGVRDYWNHGYGTAAMARLLQHAFFHLGLDLVYLRVLEHNLRAIRSYEKLGFRKRGRLEATGRLTGEPRLWLMELSAETFRASPYADHGQTSRALRAVCHWTAEA
jgi:RimJ/RimL family protein N-acetyltransferase